MSFLVDLFDAISLCMILFFVHFMLAAMLRMVAFGDLRWRLEKSPTVSSHMILFTPAPTEKNNNIHPVARNFNTFKIFSYYYICITTFFLFNIFAILFRSKKIYYLFLLPFFHLSSSHNSRYVLYCLVRTVHTVLSISLR